MKKVTPIWKMAFVMLFVLGGMLSFSFKADAAAKPYEYTFVKGSSTFNEINSINKLVINFDKNITANASDLYVEDATDNPIYIEQDGGTKLDIIKGVTVSGNELTVTFKNLEYIDYIGVMDYTLFIDKEVLYFDQLDGFEIPFKIYDILPGFKSTFIDTDAEKINKNIFKINAPRDVFVHVPKIFITGIETIHHYDGILPNPLPDEDELITKDPNNPNTQRNPSLTNIDVLADEVVSRLKVELGDTKGTQYSRDLTRRTDVEGFSMGQAGIDDITDSNTESVDEFHLRAYNDYGRFLEERKFKLRVTDPVKDYIISDYIKEPTGEFGQTYSLYDLMADQTLLENVISRIPVSQLDSLGITYAVGNSTVSVSDLEELNMALNNPRIKEIQLAGDIDLNGTAFTINRDITISGYGFKGDVVLGDGNTDITVRLNNVTVDGNVTVDVGTNGTAVLDNSSSTSTTIISGGIKSVHLNNYKSTKGITLANTSPIRIVTSDKLTDSLTISGTGDVTLEGEYNSVKVTTPIKLNSSDTLKIDTLTVDSGVTLTVVVFGEGGDIPTDPVDGEIKYVSANGSALKWTEDLLEMPGWASNDNSTSISIILTIGKNSPYDLTGISNWSLVNKDAFGQNSEISYDGETLTITKTRDTLERYEADVIFQDSTGKYEVTIPVKIVDK